MSTQRPPWLVVALLVIALVSTAGQATAAEAQPHQHGGTSDASGISHGRGGTAQNTPPITPATGWSP
jgi:hypothetical protein